VCVCVCVCVHAYICLWFIQHPMSKREVSTNCANSEHASHLNCIQLHHHIPTTHQLNKAPAKHINHMSIRTILSHYKLQLHPMTHTKSVTKITFKGLQWANEMHTRPSLKELQSWPILIPDPCIAHMPGTTGFLRGTSSGI